MIYSTFNLELLVIFHFYLETKEILVQGTGGVNSPEADGSADFRSSDESFRMKKKVSSRRLWDVDSTFNVAMWSR
jgi:hypothetical protein